MGRELGRISGPLLAENLLRNGNNLAFESKLLYLDVVNKRIGVNSSIPTRDLLVSGITNISNSLIVDTDPLVTTNIADLEFATNNIKNVVGSISIVPDQSTDPTVTVPKLTAGDLQFYTNTITNLANNSNIVLDPTGKLIVGSLSDLTNVLVNGSLHATGNITLDGQIKFGSDDQDNIVFNADVNSDFVPAITNEYDIGSATKEWSDLFSHSVNSTQINLTSSATVDNINVLFEQGNTLYVSVNGDDTNVGTHLQATYRSIKYALSQAQDGDEVVIFPGDYVEEFPLTIPAGVSVRGAGIRSVSIAPTEATKNKDCFLLNGETTVSFLTIKDFFKDEANNTGYAFKFAPGIKITTRSPYIYNVTVITKGSVTSSSDPTGYNQNDAGGGAYIDGSVVDPTSLEPAALFFSATFIVPNNTGIHVLNGARAEWLNSFTYFAKRGIYLTEGTLGLSGLGVKFGAEIRSINSANVYGEFGAVADGPSTLGYLIGHNFGYIGSGGDSNNDYGLVIQGNEVVPINDGQLYYDSMDHKGDFRIGDIFYVLQSTGQVVFNAQSINLGSGGSITLESSQGRTYIDLYGVTSDNIYIHGNNVDSLSGPIILSAASNVINLNDNIADNVNVTGNVDITGNFTIEGTMITFGNTITDTVTIVDYFTQDVNPKTNNTYSLGSPTSRWNNLYLSNQVDVGNKLRLESSTITSLETNANIVLAPNGTGKVVIADNLSIDNNLTIGQNLTVSGTTTLLNTSLGAVTQNGAFNQQSGNTDITGNLSSRSVILNSAGSILYLPGINVSTNTIESVTTNTDFVITANGTGKVYIPSNNVSLDQNLTVSGILTQTQPTTFDNLNVVGTITHVGDFTQTGDYTLGTINSSSISITDPLGVLTLPDFSITGNTIGGTVTNGNIVIQADGTGKVVFNNVNVDLGTALSVGGTFTLGQTATFGNINTGSIVQVGNFSKTGNSTITGDLVASEVTVNGSNYIDLGNFRVENQTISGKLTNSDVYYTADGVGVVKLGPTVYISGTEIVATVAQTFSTEDGITFISEDGQEFVTEGNNESLDIQISPNNGSLVIDATSFLKVPSSDELTHTLATTGEIRFNPASSTYAPGVYGLEGYDGTGKVWMMNVFSADRQTGIFEDANIINFFTNDETIRSYIDSTKWKSNNTLELANFSFVNNTISNTNDSYISVTGTGVVYFNNIGIDVNDIPTPSSGPLTLSNTGTGYVKFAGTNGVVLGVGTTANYPATPEVGTVRYNTELNYPEVYDAVQGWIPFSGQPITENELIDINDLWALILG